MALSGRQPAGAALAGTPEARAAARIARCSHSHETLHRSRVTVPPRDRSGIITHHLHVTDDSSKLKTDILGGGGTLRYFDFGGTKVANPGRDELSREKGGLP